MGQLEDADTTRLTALMRSFPLWDDFSEDDLGRLVTSGALRRHLFGQGEVVVEQGNYEKTFFLLLSGRVRVLRDNREVAVLAEPGAVIGEMSFVLGKGRTATVLADVPTDCLVVDMGYVDFLESPVREDFLIRIFRRLAEVVAKRLGSANARKASLLTAIRERREKLRSHITAERQAIFTLKRELESLDTTDDEAVLRQLLDRRF